MSKRKTSTKGLNTTDYKGISMSKETGFVIVGLIDSSKQATEIQGIVKLSILGTRMQNLPKEV